MAPVVENIGYWGPPTSTLDWCESNYEVSYYMAEFWNTITNLSMIIPPLNGIFQVYQQKFEFRFAFLYICLLITGIGSWMFHMTLLYEMQLLDELPMVWGSSYMVYCLYKVQIEPHQKTPKMAFAMISYSMAVTIVYLIDKNPVFHEAAYGVLVATLMFMDIKLNMDQNSKRGWQIFWLGFFLYILGFILWNIDNEMCQSLQKIRSQIYPEGLTPLTQLHGWWHLLAGYATHLHIQSCIHHRQIYLKEEVEFQLTWIGLEVKRIVVQQPKEKLK